MSSEEKAQEIADGLDEFVADEWMARQWRAWLQNRIIAALDEARAQEREACAKFVEETYQFDVVADRIRNRKEVAK